MQEIVKAILEFFYHPKISISKKFISTIIFFLIIVAVEDHIGFVHRLTITNKLEEIKKVDAVITSPLSDTLSKKYAQYLKEQIIERRPFSDYIFLRFRSSWISWYVKNKYQSEAPAIAINKVSAIKDSFLFYVTCAGVIVFIGLALTLFFVINPDKSLKISLAAKIGSVITLNTVFLSIGGIIWFLISQLPLISDNPEYIYSFNLLLQLVVLLVLMFLFHKYMKAKEINKKDE